jgi:D-3-phosphoglycerate dehydrogenase
LTKILLADRIYLNEKALLILQELGSMEYSNASNEEELAREVADVDVILVETSPITERVINAAKALKGIVVFGVGYDCVDVKAASYRGIYVANCRGANAEAVAEMVFFKILDLARRGTFAHNMVTQGKWNITASGENPDWLMGSELFEKTIGVIGFGEIGKRVVRIARGFRMNILVADPYVDARVARAAGALLVELQQLVKESDVITLHVPLMPETRELFGEKEFSMMKKSAFLINTSRGMVVNETSMVTAMRSGRIAGLGLDVFTKEPLPAGSENLTLENTSLSPHVAGNTKEANVACAEEVAINAQMILHGKIPRNTINLKEIMARSTRSLPDKA